LGQKPVILAPADGTLTLAFPNVRGDMSVFDPRAQNGVVGKRRHDDLKDALRFKGLQPIEFGRVGEPHGVGGSTRVFHKAPMPIGIGGCSGLVEIIVVEMDTPFLPPATTMAELRALLDLSGVSANFRTLAVEVPLGQSKGGHLLLPMISEFGTNSCLLADAVKGWPRLEFKAAYRR